MKNKTFKISLCVTLLTFSIALAKPQQDNDFLDNVRVAADFAFGVPLGWSVAKEVKEKVKVGDKSVELGVSPNMNLGILLGYNFWINENVTIGPELGFNYGFTRKIQLKNRGVILEEKYLQFPLYLRMASTSSEESLVGGNFILGYDVNLFLSSSYKQSGDYTDLPESFKGDKDLYKSIADLPKISGNIVLGGGLEFPKGFYLIGKLKIPTELIQVLKDRKDADDKGKQLDVKFVKLARCLTASLVEFSVGVDIIQLVR